MHRGSSGDLRSIVKVTDFYSARQWHSTGMYTDYARRRAGRLQAIKNVLEGIGAGQAETRHAVAVVSLLASADAGTVLADQYGLTLDQAGRACAQTARAIIDSLTAQATTAPGTPPAGEPGRLLGTGPLGE